MRNTIQTVLIYTIIAAVLRGLVVNEKYLRYMEFFSGLVLLLLMAGPIFALVSQDNSWYENLQKKYIQIDREEMERELQLAGEGFEEMLEERCTLQMEEQVKELGREQGIELTDARVNLEKKDGRWEISDISGTTGEVKMNEKAVETVAVDKEKSVEGKEDKKIQKLTKKLCEYYQLKEEQIRVWR